MSSLDLVHNCSGSRPEVITQVDELLLSILLTVALLKAEIAPSKAVPGELTYFFGALGDPTTDEYKSQEAFES